MTQSLSIQQARKLVLLSQKLPPSKQSGSSVAATLSAIEHLGYIQIDTISVIQRAHHHTLWNRNPRYKPEHLDQLIADKRVFEYWSHAAAYLPMCHYRFSLPRKQALVRGDQSHWFPRNDKLMQSVLKRIDAEGPMMAKDFDDKHFDDKHLEDKTGKSKAKPGDWKSKPSKQALETLYMQGDLMVSSRLNFHKVYDLTERVLPEGTNTSEPNPEEYSRFLITQYLLANGLGQSSEIAYLLKNTKPMVTATLNEMEASGELLKIALGNGRGRGHSRSKSEGSYYALPKSLELLEKPLSRSKLKILSPFDNLLIQRKRMKALFDFDYLIECYVPAAKRKYGYFSLPILWDGKLVARMCCKVDKAGSVLNINHLALEPTIKNKEAFLSALHKELDSFLAFHNCCNYQIYRTTPASFKQELESVI